MKKLGILQEFKKCDTETQSEQMPFEKQHQWACLMQYCHKSQFVKNKVSVKSRKVNQNETMYATKSKMNDSPESGHGMRNQDYVVVIRYLCYP